MSTKPTAATPATKAATQAQAQAPSTTPVPAAPGAPVQLAQAAAPAESQRPVGRQGQALGRKKDKDDEDLEERAEHLATPDDEALQLASAEEWVLLREAEVVEEPAAAEAAAAEAPAGDAFKVAALPAAAAFSGMGAAIGLGAVGLAASGGGSGGTKNDTSNSTGVTYNVTAALGPKIDNGVGTTITFYKANGEELGSVSDAQFEIGRAHV